MYTGRPLTTGKNSSMQILGTPQRTHSRVQLDTRSVADAWTIMSWVGMGFLVMAGTDIALAWYPTSFGNPEWEFGAISASLNALAIPTLALYLILASAIARRHVTFARVLAVVLILLAIVILFMGIIYATVVPQAFTSVSKNELLASGMRRAVIKAVVLIFAYIVLMVAGAIRAWRVSARLTTE
jgi:hypothetical protein